MPKTKPVDTYSDAYDEWFERNREIYAAELEAVRQLLPSPDAKGVEVGVLEDAGFSAVGIRQTLIPDEKNYVVLDGFGEGAFVEVRGENRIIETSGMLRPFDSETGRAYFSLKGTCENE